MDVAALEPKRIALPIIMRANPKLSGILAPSLSNSFPAASEVTAEIIDPGRVIKA